MTLNLCYLIMELLSSEKLKKIIKVNYEDLKTWATLLKEGQQESHTIRKAHSQRVTQLSSFNTTKSSITNTIHSYAKLKSHNPTPHHCKFNTDTQDSIVPMIRKYKHTKLRNKVLLHSFGETTNRSFDKKEGKCPKVLHKNLQKSVTFRILNDTHSKNSCCQSKLNVKCFQNMEKESKLTEFNNSNSNSNNIPNFTTTLNAHKPKLSRKVKIVNEEFKTKYVNLMIKPDLTKILRRKLKPQPVRLTILDKERIRRYLSLIKFSDHWTQKLLQLNNAEITVKEP